MASIDSNAIVQFFNVPWDSGYRNLRYFSSASARDSWFASKAADISTYPLNDEGHELVKVSHASPVRLGKGYVISENWDKWNQFNYLRFKNREYSEGDWNYCFITGWEYISAHSAKVYFERDAWINNIGVMQFGDMYIERENTDTVNDLPEPVSINRYIRKMSWTEDPSGLNTLYCLLASTRMDGEAAECTIDRVKYPMYLDTSYDISNILQTVKQFVDAGRDANLVMAFALPGEYVLRDDVHTISFKTKEVVASRKTGSYTPKNKKCLRYPFCYCQIGDYTGNSQILKWENGSGGSLHFWIRGGVGGNGLAQMSQRLSTGGSASDDGYTTSIAHSISVPIGLTGGGYASWLAQNMATINGQQQQQAISTGSQLAGTVGSAITGAAIGGKAGVAGALVGGIAGAAIDLAGFEISQNTMMANAEFTPTNAQVPQGSIVPLYTMGLLGFFALSVYPCKSEMVALDNFFTRYGYTVNRIGKPNIHGSHYFIKTSGAVVTGKCPQEERNLIMAALDRGVTFWTTDSFDY